MCLLVIKPVGCYRIITLINLSKTYLSQGLTGRRVGVQVDGGTLAIEWRADDHVTMTGPAAISFTGTLAAEMLA